MALPHIEVPAPSAAVCNQPHFLAVSKLQLTLAVADTSFLTAAG